MAGKLHGAVKGAGAGSRRGSNVTAARGPCVLDVCIDSRATRPWVVDSDLYIREVLLGLRGDATQSGDPERSVNPGWNHLRRCLGCSPASKVGEILFWLCLGIVFERADAVALSKLRDQLAQSWLQLSLEVRRGREEPDTVEWVLEKFTAVFAQLVFRMLVDAFERDRSIFNKHSDAVLLKLTQIIHYELTGFQASKESHVKTRQQLFMRRVILGPHVNQFEFLAGQKRQEELKSRVEMQQRLPLSFGDSDSHPLDQGQMDHVFEERRKEMSKSATMPTSTMQKSKSEVLRPGSPWTDDLSVENYAFLTQIGEDMLEKQLNVLAAQAAEVDEELRLGRRRKSSVAIMKEAMQATTAALWFVREKSPEERQQEEMREAELQKQRDLAVAGSIALELPKDLQNRNMFTTWVSPVTQRLKPAAEDRFILKKPSAESRELQMAGPSPAMSKKIVSPKLPRPKSMPAVARAPEKQSPNMRRISKEKSHAKVPDTASSGPAPPGSLGSQELILGPPQRICNEDVLKRLECQLDICRNASFGVYMKNFDIVTGQRKAQFCDEKLHREEAEYVKKMEGLVKGTLRRATSGDGGRKGPPSDMPRFRQSKEFVTLFTPAPNSFA